VSLEFDENKSADADIDELRQLIIQVGREEEGGGEWRGVKRRRGRGGENVDELKQLSIRVGVCGSV
jgi:hypothetical protein